MIELYNKDNLELLKTLPDNHIDLIYCDILYGTGTTFNDYADLKTTKKDIEEHYIPRLTEMYRVLKNTGTIYLQMDTRINHWLRCIMDDIFGYENFRNELVWLYKTQGFSKNSYSKKHDVVLFYTKTDNYTFNLDLVREPEISESVFKRSGKDINEDGKYFRIKNGKPYEINAYSPPLSWFQINAINASNKERVGYDTQKPTELIKKFILASSNENDLVADFYLGSGTTAVVSKDLNRNFIGCDINPRAIEITNKRLKNVYTNTELF